MEVCKSRHSDRAQHPRTHLVLESDSAPSLSRTMCDLFLLLGTPPDAKDGCDPRVLVAFPPFCFPEIHISRIIHFCMPTGTKRISLSSDESSIIQDEFVFQISVNGENLYGVCIHVHLTQNQKKSKEGRPFFISKNNENNNFCFCLLSKVPAFGVHFMFLTYLALTTFGKVGINENLQLDDLNVTFPIGEPIDGLDLDGHIGFHPSIKLPDYFEYEIIKYYKLSLMESQFIEFHKDFQLYFPLELSLKGKSILYASLDTLFSLLSIIDILRIINGILLDGQILVIGSHLHEVSMCIYALQEIISPFTFSGTIIPILPESDMFFDLLNLPTPFLIGVGPYPKLQKMVFLESIIFVNLDKRIVSETKSYPSFPQSIKLTTKLSKLLSQHRCVEQNNDFGATHIFTKTLKHRFKFTPNTSDAICQTILSPFSSFFSESIYMYFITDTTASSEGVTLFNQELFLSQAPTQDKQFYRDLINSQTFRMYIEKRISEFKLKRNSKPVHISRRRSSFKSLPEVKVQQRSKSIQLDIDEE